MNTKTRKLIRGIMVVLIGAYLTACRTVEIPLAGVMVGRPHTMGSQIGIRATAGVADAPKVQGVVDEVPDSEGEVLNPLAKDSYKGDHFSLPFAEFGIGFAKRCEIDVSTHRGVSGMVDVYRDPRYTVSLTASHARMSYRINSKEKNEEERNKEKEDHERLNITLDDVSGSSSNTNITVLSSARFGDQVWAQFSIYGGVGVNKFNVEIENRDLGVLKNKEQIAPSAVLGVQGKFTIFEASAEGAVIQIRERSGKDRVIPLGLVSLTTRLDWFGGK